MKLSTLNNISHSFDEVISKFSNVDNIRAGVGSAIDELVIQHDNATPHTSSRTREFIEQRNVQVLKQPAYSPD